MIIKNFKEFSGLHCETTATGNLLKQLDINLSEPMLFGLGEGLGFIFWNMKIMEFPFIGGRVKPDALTENLCRNLHLKLDVKETASKKKAWENVATYIARGKAVGLKLDCYHLDYFTNKIHFAGHYAAMYGYDNTKAYLIDTSPQGSRQTTLLENLALARSEKGPMSSKNLSYTISKNGQDYDLKQAIKTAIGNNTNLYLNPPIKNLGYKGILKTASEIKKWFRRSENVPHEFQTTAMLMERAGTGGALFRNLYRDFLKESHALLGIPALQEAYQQFSKIAPLWTKVSGLLHQAGETQDIAYINECAEILKQLSQMEYEAMSLLKNGLE